MQRCSFSCACFSQRERAMIEVEGSERSPAVWDYAFLAPVQPPGDHQMQDQPEVIVKSDGDSLPNAAQAGDAMFENCCQRRIGRAQQGWSRRQDLLKDVAENPA